MKILLNLILWLPRLLIRIVWRSIWGVVQTILVLAIVLFGLIYYANHSDSPLANQISNITNALVNRLPS